jgi:hypothetical protein
MEENVKSNEGESDFAKNMKSNEGEATSCPVSPSLQPLTPVDVSCTFGASTPPSVRVLRYPLCGAPNKPRKACCLCPVATACPRFNRHKDTVRRGPPPQRPVLDHKCPRLGSKRNYYGIPD